MRLLADLGNTRLKLARCQGTQVQPLATFVHAEPDFHAQLDAWIGAQALPQSVWLASVAESSRTRDVVATFAAAGITVHTVATQRETLGLVTTYTRVEQLGVDRWLALLALHVGGAAPCLAVGVGSALTCDALTADGEHLGGLIAPTPEAMRQALRARAPGLPAGNGAVEAFARNTEDGIESGCVLAAVSLIERTQSALAKRLGKPVRLVLSGGAAGSLRPLLPAHEFRPDLVLEGLALWSDACTAGGA